MSDSEPDEEDLKAEGKVKLMVLKGGNVEDATIFVLRHATPFVKAFAAWGKKYRVDFAEWKFLHHQTGLLNDNTPKMMEWKVGRTYSLDALPKQEGGSN